MLQYPPQREVRVIRFLNNPLDLSTYYCKAFVYDAVTYALIEAFALTDDGDKTFSRLWQTPADPSGQGRQLIVSIVCYDDADYTSVSPVYGTEKDSWLIQLAGQNFGGGTAGIDYAEVRSILRKILQEAESERAPADLSAFESEVRGLREALSGAMRVHDGASAALERRSEDASGAVAGLLKAVTGAQETLARLTRALATLEGGVAESGQAAVEGIREAAQEAADELGNRVGSIADLALRGIRDEVESAKGALAEAVKAVADGFVANPMQVTLAPQGDMRASVGRAKAPQAAEAPPRGLRRLTSAPLEA